MSEKIADIPIDDIETPKNFNQPPHYDALYQSILQAGMMFAVGVAEVSTGKYRVVFGAARFMVAKKIHELFPSRFANVSCKVVKLASDEDLARMCDEAGPKKGYVE